MEGVGRGWRGVGGITATFGGFFLWFGYGSDCLSLEEGTGDSERVVVVLTHDAYPVIILADSVGRMGASFAATLGSRHQ